jgi:hypothetical protein
MVKVVDMSIRDHVLNFRKVYKTEQGMVQELVPDMETELVPGMVLDMLHMLLLVYVVLHLLDVWVCYSFFSFGKLIFIPNI